MFILLRRIERWLHQHIFKVGWLMTHNYQTTTILYYTFFLPGVVLHEVVYWLAAGMLNVRAERALQWPEAQEIGELKLNFVKIAPRTNIYRKAFITIAPLVVGLALIWLIASSVFNISLVLETMSTGELTDIAAAINILTNAPDFWLWIYFIFTISNTMYPTIPNDLRGWRVLLGGALAVMLTLTVIGLGSGIFNTVATPLANILTVLQATLLLMIGIDLVMVAVLGSIEATIERITGHTATFRGGKMMTMTRQEAQEEAEREAERERRRRERERRRAEEQAKPITIYALTFSIPGAPGDEPITQIAIDTPVVEPPVESDEQEEVHEETPEEMAARINLPSRPTSPPEIEREQPIPVEEDTAPAPPIKSPGIRPFGNDSLEDTAAFEPVDVNKPEVEDNQATEQFEPAPSVEAVADEVSEDDAPESSPALTASQPEPTVANETALPDSQPEEIVSDTSDPTASGANKAPISEDAVGQEQVDTSLEDAVDAEPPHVEDDATPSITIVTESDDDKVTATPIQETHSDDDDDDEQLPDFAARLEQLRDQRNQADTDASPDTAQDDDDDDEQLPDFAARLEQLRTQRDQDKQPRRSSPFTSPFSKPETDNSSEAPDTSRFGNSPFRFANDASSEDETAQPARSRFGNQPSSSPFDPSQLRMGTASDSADNENTDSDDRADRLERLRNQLSPSSSYSRPRPAPKPSFSRSDEDEAGEDYDEDIYYEDVEDLDYVDDEDEYYEYDEEDYLDYDEDD